jgi:hypothetical protein
MARLFTVDPRAGSSTYELLERATPVHPGSILGMRPMRTRRRVAAKRLTAG